MKIESASEAVRPEMVRLRAHDLEELADGVLVSLHDVLSFLEVKSLEKLTLALSAMPEFLEKLGKGKFEEAEQTATLQAYMEWLDEVEARLTHIVKSHKKFAH